MKQTPYQERYHVRLIVGVLAEKNGKWLFIEEHKKGRRLSEPVGHVEPHESIIPATEREYREETGYRVRIKGLVGIYHNIYGRRSVSDSIRLLFFGTILGQGEAREEDVQLHWINRRSLTGVLPRLTHPTSRKGLMDFLRGDRYPLSVIREMHLEPKKRA